MFKRSGVKYRIHAPHRTVGAVEIAHVTNVKFQLGIPVFMAYIILLFLVPREDADLADVVLKNRLSTALPKLPVPPVTKSVLSLNIF